MNRPQIAKQYFLQGYNCAQAVSMAFADVINMDKNQIALLTSGFGGGVGRMREVCGTVTGATFVISALYGYSDPHATIEKQKLYADIQQIGNTFIKENGSVVCRELLGLTTKGADNPTPEARTEQYYKKRPCVELVEYSAQLVDDFIKNQEK